jgi:signal transduction histidine kinase
MAQRDEIDVPAPLGSDSAASLSFPDVPRLELDQLLGQLVDRAQEVMATQGRLRGLLRANQLVSSDLTSSAVLQRTAEAARDLVRARCAAVDLYDPGGAHVESGRAAGDTGRPAPADADAEMTVPIQACGEDIGTVRFTGSARGRFSTEDRQLALALATTVSMAIQNARLYEAARRRGEWLQASAAIIQQLLSGDEGGRHPLELIARSSRHVAEADLVAVLRLHDEDSVTPSLRVDVLVGPEGVRPAGQPVPLEGAWLGQVFTAGRPLVLTTGETHQLGPAPWDGPDVGAVLAAPLVGSRTTHGVLCAARLPGRPEFTPTDLEMAAGFANQAAVAIELADARAEQQRAVLLDERERIAADLHNTVVQRLFGIGLSLQGVLAEIGNGRAAERIRATVDEVDRTINRIRSALFPLQPSAPPPARNPRDRVLDAVTELVPGMGVEPDVRFSGLLTGVMAPDLVEDLVAVVRGALQDVARRGRATTVSVDLVQDRDGLVVHVRDDDAEGAGAATGKAAADLRRRAERHGGTLTVSAGTRFGTSLYWWVPQA